MGSSQTSCYVYYSLLQLFQQSTTGSTYINRSCWKHVNVKLQVGLTETAAIKHDGKSKMGPCLPYLNDGLTLHNIALHATPSHHVMFYVTLRLVPM